MSPFLDVINYLFSFPSEFMASGSKAEINIDGKTMEATKKAMATPSRYTFETAAEHVYNLLLKKDCYPRFIRSDHYKTLVSNSITASKKQPRYARAVTQIRSRPSKVLSLPPAPFRFPFPFAKKKASTIQPQAGQMTPGRPSVSTMRECFLTIMKPIFFTRACLIEIFFRAGLGGVQHLRRGRHRRPGGQRRRVSGRRAPPRGGSLRLSYVSIFAAETPLHCRRRSLPTTPSARGTRTPSTTRRMTRSPC